LKRKSLIGAIVLIGLVLLAATIWIWQRNGAYGFHVMARRGGTYWTKMGTDDPRLSLAMREALKEPVPAISAGKFAWREAEPGFEVAELPVMSASGELDRILLNRIDPARFSFVVRNAPKGDKGIDEWEQALPKAVLIVNGSYFDLKGKPDTPFISQGEDLGPREYDAKAGAFVARLDGSVAIHDLRQAKWQDRFMGAKNAMVSYPLLLGADGQTHVNVKSRWLANRTFVAQDHAGRILIGTTKEAFFSLDRLASFLKDSPLELALALNLDGGPIACQSVRLHGFQRKFYAHWEAQVRDNEVNLLRWPFGEATWAMPIVLTVERAPASGL
jgi:hypothetical protein